MLERKQNVFDDFIASAEYLINNKYTSSERFFILNTLLNDNVISRHLDNSLTCLTFKSFSWNGQGD